MFHPEYGLNDCPLIKQKLKSIINLDIYNTKDFKFVYAFFMDNATQGEA